MAVASSIYHQTLRQLVPTVLILCSSTARFLAANHVGNIKKKETPSSISIEAEKKHLQKI